MMNYREWVQWLETRNPMPELKPGIEKTRNALTEAGLMDLVDPKKVIIIAGTNGKGTTAKTLEQLLLSTGSSVGLYTSPHLVDTTERIRIQGKDLTQNAFCSLCEHYRPLIEKWNLTHFESLTLFAADYFFKQKKVDWSIFEVGLGGTWDATNVIPHHWSAITALGFDHMHILGKTLPEIAMNKFGIIAKNNVVIHNDYDPEIEAILAEQLKKNRATSIRVSKARHRLEPGSPLPQYILESPWGDTAISLPGVRATQNMLQALTIFEVLGFNPQKYLKTLSTIQWPARMTPLKYTSPCPVYLSGDHNTQGIESLVEILKHAQYKKLHLILGVSKNRAPLEFLPILAQLQNTEVTFTKPTFQGVTPQLPPGMTFFEKPHEALQHVSQKAQAQDLIVITGSLYLCGDYLKGI